MLETYEAYADYLDVAAMTEELVAHVARETLGTLQVERDGRDDRPHAAVAAGDAARRDPGARPASTSPSTRERDALLAAMRAGRHRANPEPGTGWGKLVDELLSKRVEPTLVQPTFVLDYPVELSPFAKPHRSRAGAGRALRGVHRRHRDRERVQRAERPRRAARALRAAAAAAGGGRRGGAALRRGLPARARAGHAADGRPRARHRPAADDPRRPALDPRGRAVPGAAGRADSAVCTLGRCFASDSQNRRNCAQNRLGRRVWTRKRGHGPLLYCDIPAHEFGRGADLAGAHLPKKKGKAFQS